MLSLLAFALTASAIPMSQPQFGGSGSSSSTANDVTDKAPCTPLTVIFARGTGEPGNIGSIVGPPLLQALQSKLGASSVAFQGVPYAASAAVSGSIYTSKSLPIWVWPLLNSGLYQGNLDDGGNGGSLMTSLAQQALQQCPNTKVVLSGYSQGGFVVHSAASSLASTPPLGGESHFIFAFPNYPNKAANVAES